MSASPAYALLFPGQGSQALQMLAAHHDPLIAQTWAEASAVLGWDLARLVGEGPLEQLNRTEYTQPALLAAGVALWRLWQAQQLPAPQALAGHSLGEYSALVAAGSLAFADALRLVQLRGRLMQSAVPEGQGGMAAVIGASDETVVEICAAWSGEGVLEPVNYNAPGQVVVAGHVAALDWLQAEGKARGARLVMRLPVSVPSHCSLMRGAAEELAAALAGVTLAPPRQPVFHNVDAMPRQDPPAIRSALVEQLYRPVRWTQTLQALHRQGIGLFLECGPGKVLAGLNKRTLDGARSIGLEDPAGLAAAVTALRAA
ncbi:MAG TPA: ACP S-malonyltransferase [Nevskiaceae bacterium]|nr:ACP S-malonyltransferase [Nevskiaceae bacterium]